jgi:hypothetical protein
VLHIGQYLKCRRAATMLETVVLPLSCLDAVSARSALNANSTLTVYHTDSRTIDLRDVSHWKLYGDGALIFIMTQTEPAILARYNKQLRGWLSYAFARYRISCH